MCKDSTVSPAITTIKEELDFLIKLEKTFIMLKTQIVQIFMTKLLIYTINYVKRGNKLFSLPF